MELQRKLAEFTKWIEDKREICILCIRSILEQPCEVWHSCLNEENVVDLERVQKAAIISNLGEKYKYYENGLPRIFEALRNKMYEEWKSKNK